MDNSIVIAADRATHAKIAAVALAVSIAGFAAAMVRRSGAWKFRPEKSRPAAL